MRTVVSLFALASVTLFGCRAPEAENACADLCDQLIYTCGAPVTDAACMWTCMAGMEWRKQKGRRCYKQQRREVACLAKVDDCDFLLEEISYGRGDPCAERGNARANACNERGVPADELVPLDLGAVTGELGELDEDADEDESGDSDDVPALGDGETVFRTDAYQF